MRVTRQLFWASLGTILALGVVFTALVPWAVRRKLTAVAQSRGWQLEATGARIGLRGIWFSSVRLDWRHAASVHVELRPVRIGWSSLLGEREVSVGSGTVRITGTWDQLRELQESRHDEAGARKSTRSTDLDVHEISLDWSEREGSAPLVALRRLELERASGNTRARVAEACARYQTVAVELKDVSVAPTTPTDSAIVESPFQIAAGEFLLKYDVSNLDAPAAPAVAAATTADAETSANPIGTQPPARDKAATAKARHAAAKSGTFAGAAKPHDQPVATVGKKEMLPVLSRLIDRIEQLRSDLSLVASDATDRLASNWLSKVPTGAKFETATFRIRISDAGQKLDLGPWAMRGERLPHESTVELAQSANADRSALSAQLRVADRFESAKAKFSVGPIGLSQLGINNGDFGLENVDSTELLLEAYAELNARTGLLSTESKGRIARLSLRQPFLSRQTIMNVGLEWEGAATLDSGKRQLKADKLRFSSGRISATLSGSVELGREHHSVDGSFEVPLAACQDLFDSLPQGLAPLLSGWRVEGTFATRSTVAFDSTHPTKSSVKVRIENGCRVQSVPHDVSPSRFDQPFVLEVENAQGIVEPNSFGPGTRGYVPLDGVSPYIQSALLVCEDGGFLHHDGFDREAIQNSIRENLRTGRFARGASTISMQLAKNLYLRRDKTISRKLQEAALTMLLEQSLSKSQLLELYLNVIEFGPGLYGIGPAAKRYFNTTPDRLSLAQSFFLISILPNPKQIFFGSDGRVPAGRMKYLQTLMAIAYKRGHFTQAELDAGLEEQLELGVPGNHTIAPTRWLLKDPRTLSEDGDLELPEMPLDE